jgi:hypothetical protein
LHNYQDKKAEIFYKNNYSRSTNEKNISDDNSGTSSLSSSDHYTNNKIIFNTKTKLLIDGKDNSDSKISLMNFEVSKIKKINNKYDDNLRLCINTKNENTLNDLMKELIKDNMNNNNSNSKKKRKKKKKKKN